MSLIIRPSSKTDLSRRKRKNDRSQENQPCESSFIYSSNESEIITLTKCPSKMSDLQTTSSRTMSPSPANHDTTIDIFDDSPLKEVTMNTPSKVPYSPIGSKSSTPSSKGSPKLRQKSMDHYVNHQFSKSSVIHKKRTQQSKIDLFVKWKDPVRKERADKARNKFFKKVDDPDVHNASWTVPQFVVDKKFEEIKSPSKKRITKKHKAAMSPRNNPARKPNSVSVPTHSSIPLQKDHPSSDDTVKKQLEERKQLMRQIMKEDNRKENSHRMMKEVQAENRARLKDGQVIRRNADRQLMHATDCECCKGYYDSLGLSPNSRQKRVQQSSRHRFVEFSKPKTPEHYWDTHFPGSSEKKRKKAAVSIGSKISATKKLF